MAAFASVAINDGQGTPVSHTFAATAKLENGVFLWQDRSGGIPLGYPTITVAQRLPSKGNPAAKISMRVSLPKLEDASPSTATGFTPAPKVAYSHLASMEWVFPDRGTLANRADLVAYVRNALGDTLFLNLLKQLDYIV